MIADAPVFVAVDGLEEVEQLDDFDFGSGLLANLARDTGAHGFAQVQEAAGQCPHSLSRRAAAFNHQAAPFVVENDGGHGHQRRGGIFATDGHGERCAGLGVLVFHV